MLFGMSLGQKVWGATVTETLAFNKCRSSKSFCTPAKFSTQEIILLLNPLKSSFNLSYI